MTVFLIILRVHSPLGFTLLIYAFFLLCSCGERHRNILTSFSTNLFFPPPTLLSLWHSFCPCWLSCQQLFFKPTLFFFLTLPPWTWIFIKSMPDSSVCLFQVRTFLFSPKAIGGKKQCFWNKYWLEYVFLFHLPTLLYFFPMNFYNYFISW